MIISGAWPPMTVSEYNAASAPNEAALAGLKVFAYVVMALGWMLIVWGLASYKKKSLLEKETAPAIYWYGNLVKLLVGYMLIMSTAGISLLPTLMEKKIELSFNVIIMIVQAVLLWVLAIVLSVKWCLSWRKKILGIMLENRILGNEAIRWFFILTNGIICFIVLELIIGFIGYLLGFALFIYLILPVRNHLNMRCSRCHGYWDNVVYQGRHIDDVKAENRSSRNEDLDERLSGDMLIKSRVTTNTNRTDYYVMYREDYHCVDCSHHWRRRYKGPWIGANVRKDIEKEERRFGPMH